MPHPVARKVYGQSIHYLQGAEVERKERTAAPIKLAGLAEQMFRPVSYK